MLNQTQVTEAYTASEKAIYKTSAKYGRALGKDAIEDLKQSTMLKILDTGLDETRGTIGAMAYSIGTNLTIDFLKGKTHAGADHNQDSLTVDNDDSEGTVTMDVASHAPSALALIVASEMTVALADAIGDVKPHQSDAIRASWDDSVTLTGAQRKAKCDGFAAMREMFGTGNAGKRKQMDTSKVRKARK